MQKSDTDKGQCNRHRRHNSVRMNIHEREERLKDLHQKLFTDPPERQTGQGNAKLGRGEIRVEMAADMLGEACSEVPLFYQSLELAATHLNNGKFACDEETIKPDKRSNSRDFANQNTGRVPVFDDRFSKGRRDRKQK